MASIEDRDAKGGEILVAREVLEFHNRQLKEYGDLLASIDRRLAKIACSDEILGMHRRMDRLEGMIQQAVSTNETSSKFEEKSDLCTSGTSRGAMSNVNPRYEKDENLELQTFTQQLTNEDSKYTCGSSNAGVDEPLHKYLKL